MLVQMPRRFRLLSRAGLAQRSRRLCLGAAAVTAPEGSPRNGPLELQPCNRRVGTPASREALQAVLFGRTPLGGDPVVPLEAPSGFVTLGFPAAGASCSYSVGAWMSDSVLGGATEYPILTANCTGRVEQVFLIGPGTTI